MNMNCIIRREQRESNLELYRISTMLVVLCIHANSMVMINWLWKDFLNVSSVYEWSFTKLVFFSIITVVGVFTACTVIDLVRSEVIEKHFLNWLEKNKFVSMATE